MTNGRLIAFALLLIVLFNLLIGCKDAAADQPDATAPLEPTEVAQPEDTFIITEVTRYYFVMYHCDTKVMYVCSKGTTNIGGIIVMVDADGKPLLWEGNDNG